MEIIKNGRLPAGGKRRYVFGFGVFSAPPRLCGRNTKGRAVLGTKKADGMLKQVRALRNPALICRKGMDLTPRNKDLEPIRDLRAMPSVSIEYHAFSVLANATEKIGVWQ
jgi:hypothetical protein